ncbi:hypothetical protein E0I26_05935 [Flavobacterium rhamnosiphilum]|uniref:Uncharacterized protein n=1 Tax=Flavobacterium rhamnosiphilum TaxID=2541724 RepID=A0A4V2Z9I1_9FLAO|nr:hypothetical protein [Flavobacterium rhamnosiphilum]TDE45488.1 hypothetical protein E0I26_05935 [Flavobacterium rhamnosiphilum]
MDIKKQQEDLVTSIKNELSLKSKIYKPSLYLDSVWFQPKTGRFLFNDTFKRYEIVEPLIECGVLIFKGIENHQDEKMLRYVLSLNENNQILKNPNLFE